MYNEISNLVIRLVEKFIGILWFLISGSDMEDMDNHGMDRVESQGFQSIAGETDYTHTNQVNQEMVIEIIWEEKHLGLV